MPAPFVDLSGSARTCLREAVRRLTRLHHRERAALASRVHRQEAELAEAQEQLTLLRSQANDAAQERDRLGAELARLSAERDQKLVTLQQRCDRRAAIIRRVRPLLPTGSVSRALRRDIARCASEP